jgi:hypothetical protein
MLKRRLKGSVLRSVVCGRPSHPHTMPVSDRH